MNKFGSKTFKLSLVVVFGFFIVGLLIINFNSPDNTSVPIDDLSAGVRLGIQEVENNGIIEGSVKCEGYGYCHDRKNMKCGDGTTCTMVAICHPTAGCAYSDCCAGHGGFL